MRYMLMHKNIPVATLDLDEAVCDIRKIEAIHNQNHLPVGVDVHHDIVDRAGLNQWWMDRSIPASRSGVQSALETLNLANTKMLLTKCFGLSLSDQYWIRPVDRDDVKWKDVNFFDNEFSEDIGDVLLGKRVKSASLNLHSPDNTSDGCLKKRWKIISGKRCLIKAGSAPLMLQPFNEVIATKIMERLNIPHVPYWMLWDDGIPYSVCEDFISRDTELVGAWRVIQTKKRENHTSIYRHYIDCCQSLGIEDIVHAIDQMIVLDYIIANEDRHLNNFGLIRNAETLEWIGVAPIFDSGSSLGYNKLPVQLLSDKSINCKPFKKKHEDQLKLVTNFAWIDFDALSNVDQIVYETFDDAGVYADEMRLKAMVAFIKRRIAYLQEFASSHAEVVDDIVNDVTENVQETY